MVLLTEVFLRLKQHIALLSFLTDQGHRWMYVPSLITRPAAMFASMPVYNLR